jgi:hypothetical protein
MMGKTYFKIPQILSTPMQPLNAPSGKDKKPKAL